MRKDFFSLLQSLKVWQLRLFSIVLSVILTEVVVAGMGLLLKHEVPLDYLLTGFVASCFVATLVVSMLSCFLDKLTESQLQLKCMVDVEPECVTLLAADGALLQMNGAGLRMIEADSFEQVMGQSIEELVLPAYRKDFMQLIKRVFTGGSGSLEFEIRGLKGTHRWMETHAVPLRDAHGHITSLLGVTRDISERKEIEASLREEVAFSKTLMSSLPGVVYRLDTEGHLVEWNDTFAKVLGPESLKMAQLDVLSIFAEQDRATVANKIAESFAKGFADVQAELKVAEGEYRSFYFVGKTVTTHRQTYLLGTGIDMTESVKASQALQRESQKNLALLRNASDGIHILDGEGNIIEVSDSFCTLLGYERAEVIGMNVVEWDAHFAPDECLKVFKQQFRKSVHSLFETQHRCKDGSIIDVEVSGFPMELDGQLVLFNSSRAITERKLAERAIVESRNLLRMIIDTAPMRVFWKDKDLRYLGCNTIFAKDFGMNQPEDLLGKDDYQMGWREQADIYRADDLAVMESGVGRLSYDEPQTTPNGEKIWLRTSKVPLKNQDNQTIGILGIYEDITQRKQLELEIKSSEARMRSILEVSPVPMALNDGAGRITFLNHAFVETFGYDTTDIPTLFDWWPKAYPDFAYRQVVVETWKNRIRIVEKEGKHFDPIELIICCKNGEKKTALITAAMLTQSFKDEHLVVFYDITELKQTEEVARAAFQYARSLIEVSLDPLVMISPDGKITDVNKATEAVTGVNRKYLIGSDFADYFTEPEKAREVYQQVFAQGFVTDYPLAIRHLCGKITEVVYNASVYTDGNGKILGMFAAARDITERKRIEEKLRESEAHLRTIIETEPECIKTVDAEGRLLQMNPAGLAMIQADSLAQVVGGIVWHLVMPQYQSAFIDMHQRVIAGERVQLQFEMVGLKGRQRWVETHAVPMLEGNETVHLAVTRDITERKQAEQALLRSNKDLEQFAYSVSHDMRQPLRSVVGHLQLLSRSLQAKLDEDEKINLDFALEGGKRMDAMIISLLDYSRVGRKTETKAWINSRKILDEAVDFLTPAILDEKVELKISGEWAQVFASQDELSRLLMNLISNAIKYREPEQPACVEIDAAVQDKVWRVSVRDYGIGIDPQQQDRLFQFFSRLQSRARFEGTGMGLALCKRIVEHHGGRIWVESAGAGQGSCFIFELPLSQLDAEELNA